MIPLRSPSIMVALLPFPRIFIACFSAIGGFPRARGFRDVADPYMYFPMPPTASGLRCKLNRLDLLAPRKSKLNKVLS